MTCYYVMLDQHQHLANYVSLASAMSPISYGAHTTGLLKLCSRFLVSLPHWLTVSCRKLTVSSLNMFPSQQSSFLPPSSWLDSLTTKFCSENSVSQSLCYDLLFSISG